MMQSLLQIISAFVGTLAFGILFNIRGKKLWLAAVGGMLSWTLFLLLGQVTDSEIFRFFIVSVIISAYAESLARLLKTPAVTFSIVSLVPLIPGSGLYYSMAYALAGNGANFTEKAVHTLGLATALSLGIVLVSALSRSLVDFQRNQTIKKRR